MKKEPLSAHSATDMNILKTLYANPNGLTTHQIFQKAKGGPIYFSAGVLPPDYIAWLVGVGYASAVNSLYKITSLGTKTLKYMEQDFSDDYESWLAYSLQKELSIQAYIYSKTKEKSIES